MLGLICRLDNGGLGIESLEFYEQLKPDKVLCVVVGDYPIDRTRFKDCPWRKIVKGAPTDDRVAEFLEGLDTVFSIETFYNPRFGNIAKDYGVRTVLKINYEWLVDPAPYADLYVAPLDWYYDKVPSPKTLLPLPVNTRRIPFRQRDRAETFVHVSGHTGVYDRNGTQEFLSAIKRVKSDVKFVVYSQNPVECNDPRVTIVREVPDYSLLYQTGDVMVLPRKYAGQAMVMNEALAAGMPVIMTEMEPQTQRLPSNWLIPTDYCSTLMIKRPIDICYPSVDGLAEIIDGWAHTDISKDSLKARAIADTFSWDTLGDAWRKLLRG